MLLARLKIIATTYHSTILKTHVFSLYSHLGIYTETQILTVYLDWLQTVLERMLSSTWRWWSSELRQSLQGHDWASVEIHLPAVTRQVCRSTLRPWSSEHRDALRGCDWTSLEIHYGPNIDMHSEAVIECVRRCPWSLWSNQIVGVLEGGRSGGGRLEACRVLRLYPLDSAIETLGMWRGDFTFEALMRTGWWQKICVWRQARSWSYF